MYLVHVRLQPSPGGGLLPGRTASAIVGAATGIADVVHVAVHADARPHPTLGVYLRAASLETAETTARVVWSVAQVVHPWLCAWTLVRAEAPMMPEIEP